MFLSFVITVLATTANAGPVLTNQPVPLDPPSCAERLKAVYDLYHRDPALLTWGIQENRLEEFARRFESEFLMLAWAWPGAGRFIISNENVTYTHRKPGELQQQFRRNEDFNIYEHAPHWLELNDKILVKTEREDRAISPYASKILEIARSKGFHAEFVKWIPKGKTSNRRSGRWAVLEKGEFIPVELDGHGWLRFRTLFLDAFIVVEWADEPLLRRK